MKRLDISPNHTERSLTWEKVHVPHQMDQVQLVIHQVVAEETVHQANSLNKCFYLVR